jgi:hypothetical protein
MHLMPNTVPLCGPPDGRAACLSPSVIVRAARLCPAVRGRAAYFIERVRAASLHFATRVHATRSPSVATVAATCPIFIDATLRWLLLLLLPPPPPPPSTPPPLPLPTWPQLQLWTSMLNLLLLLQLAGLCSQAAAAASLGPYGPTGRRRTDGLPDLLLLLRSAQAGPCGPATGRRRMDGEERGG